MAAAAKEAPGGQAILRPADAGLIRDAHGLTITPNGSQSGGVLVESADGYSVIDLRFESLIDRLWDRNLEAIHRILFD